MNRTSREKEEIRDEACSFIGREITDAEWNESYPKAERKLEWIISREGDADGARTQPWYLGKLVEEIVNQNNFARYCLEMSEKNKAALEKDDPTPPTVYYNTPCPVNA